MAKVFITGAGGVGKSTIIKHLKERGFAAYDTDDIPETTRLENVAGEPMGWPEGYVDWSKYRWNWQRPAIIKLLASGDNVFLGAIVGNWQNFVDDFDIIIVLTVDTPTHEKRLRNRNAHPHGQGEENVRERVAKQARILARFTAAGAIPVMNDRPVDEVVDEILKIAHVSK